MKYICQICGYIYDDAKEKVPFDELPADWKCPLCGAGKADFKAESTENKPVKTAELPVAEEMVELSAGQLAALFSNLVRGCEKQYKGEEAKLFAELADYFTAVVPPQNDPTVEKLAKDLQDDAESYAAIRSIADEHNDRGAARICVWGEKVTRMLSSLVKRYLAEGEAMLAGKEIWVCSTCGFVYIGEKAPELCPVCKVPAWKFEKIEGRVE